MKLEVAPESKETMNVNISRLHCKAVTRYSGMKESVSRLHCVAVTRYSGMKVKHALTFRIADSKQE
jgi:hypothetical protein